MTALLITEVFPPRTGGSGRWLWEIYRRLPREQVVIAAGQHPDQYNFDCQHTMRLTRVPLTFHSWGLLGWAPMRQHAQLLWLLQRLIADHGVTALHCGKCLPEGLAAWLLKTWYRIPYLCYVHGEELNLARGSRELTWWTRRVLAQAKMLIANSENTANLLRRQWGVSARRLHVLHPGVDTTFFVPAELNSGTRAELGWSSRRVILTVGRLQKRKGQDMMIRAVNVIRHAIPDVLYAIAGDGEERESLEELAVREGLRDHVQFLGNISDAHLRGCYQQCDLFALPNRQVGQDIEGFGMVLVEAQACGKPVVAGCSGGTAETMRVPTTGRTVCCETPTELAALVIELLSDGALRAQMGKAGRDWVVDHLNWDALSRQAAQLFFGDCAVGTPQVLPVSQCFNAVS